VPEFFLFFPNPPSPAQEWVFRFSWSGVLVFFVLVETTSFPQTVFFIFFFFFSQGTGQIARTNNTTTLSGCFFFVLFFSPQGGWPPPTPNFSLPTRGFFFFPKTLRGWGRFPLFFIGRVILGGCVHIFLCDLQKHPNPPRWPGVYLWFGIFFCWGLPHLGWPQFYFFYCPGWCMFGNQRVGFPKAGGGQNHPGWCLVFPPPPPCCFFLYTGGSPGGGGPRFSLPCHAHNPPPWGFIFFYFFSKNSKKQPTTPPQHSTCAFSPGLFDGFCSHLPHFPGVVVCVFFACNFFFLWRGSGQTGFTPFYGCCGGFPPLVC